MKPIRQSELYDALLRVLSPTEQPGPAARGRPERPPAARGRGRVLVVEDNTINQTVAAGTLAKLGYSTDLAVNGREAVEAVSRRDYAAVLMDCQMPDMDGYEATREIRKRQAGVSGPNAGAGQRHLPIIAMTASATEVDRERCLAAGMDDYLSKPVRFESMEATLERWLESPTGHAPSRAPAAEKDDDVLDRTLVDQLRELGPADDGRHQFAQLVDTFVAQSATRLDDLRQAAEGGDFEAVGRAAHSQRGSSAVMGAAALASACAALEAASKQGGGADVRARLQDVEAQLERATTALRLESQQP
jgi:CheY-like chemotaxis protein/HPt (histidine-containing phosphotransfer) domain-containing protein